MIGTSVIEASQQLMIMPYGRMKSLRWVRAVITPPPANTKVMVEVVVLSSSGGLMAMAA